MKIESEVGYNPYKMGLVGGADVHSGYQGNEEWDWNGAHGTLDDTPQKRLNPVKNATGETGYTVSSAGTTAVWASRACEAFRTPLPNNRGPTGFSTHGPGIW